MTLNTTLRWVGIALFLAGAVFLMSDEANVTESDNQAELRQVKDRLAKLEQELSNLRPVDYGSKNSNPDPNSAKNTNTAIEKDDQEEEEDQDVDYEESEDDDTNNDNEEEDEETYKEESKEQQETQPIESEQDSSDHREGEKKKKKEKQQAQIANVNNGNVENGNADNGNADNGNVGNGNVDNALTANNDILNWNSQINNYEFDWNVPAETLYSHDPAVRKIHYQNTNPPVLNWRHINQKKKPAGWDRSIVTEVPMADLQTILDVLFLNPEVKAEVGTQKRSDGIEREDGFRKAMLKTTDPAFSYLFWKTSFSYIKYDNTFEEWVYPRYLANKYPGMTISLPHDSPPMVYEIANQQQLDEWNQKSQGVLVRKGQPPKVGQMFVAQKVHMVPKNDSLMVGCPIPRHKLLVEGAPALAARALQGTNPDTVDQAVENFMSTFRKYIDLAIQIWRGEHCLKPDFQFFILYTGKIVHFDMDACDYTHPDPNFNVEALGMPKKFYRENCDEYLGGEMTNHLENTLRSQAKKIKEQQS